MKLYRDSQLTKELTTIDMGTVDAGSSQRFTFYVHNEHECHISHLEFMFDNKEVKLLVSPKEMSAKETAEVVIEWCPCVTLRKGLKTFIEMKFYEIWE